MAKNMNDLPGFDIFSKYAKLDLPVDKAVGRKDQKSKTAVLIGFQCSNGDISRLNARYRLAREFRSVELNNYAKSTEAGYSALVKSFLSWSVCDVFHDMLHTQNYAIPTISNLFSSDELQHLQKKMAAIDKTKALMDFLAQKVKPWLKPEIEKYLDCNPIAILAALRHIFVHGFLASNKDGTPIPTIIKMSELLSNAVLDVIARDFERRVKENLK